MPRKVYISCHDPVIAEEAAQQIRAAGHIVVSTWHEPPAKKPSCDEEWRVSAIRNFAQIEEQADELLLIAHPTDKVTGGKFIELGFAEGLRRNDDYIIDINIVGRFENGMATFFSQFTCVEDYIRDWLNEADSDDSDLLDLDDDSDIDDSDLE